MRKSPTRSRKTSGHHLSAPSLDARWRTWQSVEPLELRVLLSAPDMLAFSVAGRQYAYRAVTDQLLVRLESGADPTAVSSTLAARGGPLAAFEPQAPAGSVSRWRLRPGAKVNVERAVAAAAAATVVRGVEAAVPLFQEIASGENVGIGNELVVRIKPGAQPAKVLARAGYRSYRPVAGTPDQFVVDLGTTAGRAVLPHLSRLQKSADVLWAEPNYYRDIKLDTAPNDPLYSTQWHLDNTGQGGALSGVDVEIEDAWDITDGTPPATASTVVAAVIDTGVEMTHPDLASRIWTNDGEIAANGIDDDGNGWVDDVHGWDFYQNDNDPSPSRATGGGGHGTCVAGVLAATADNSAGAAGAAPAVSIMPLRISDGEYFLSDAGIAEAIYYAAGRTRNGLGTWEGASLQNNSWGYHGAADQTLTDAFTYANGTAHQPVFVAAGNEASGFKGYALTGLPVGNWQFQWEYSKDASGSTGNDTTWLGYVQLPDGSVQRFDAPSLPAGWTTSGAANWLIADDPAHAYGVGRYVARAGAIGHGQTTSLKTGVVTTTLAGTALRFQLWTSTEAAHDQVRLRAWYNGIDQGYQPITASGDATIPTGINTIATLSDNIAVGASTDWDYRAAYSCWGSDVDVVAPSNGGYQSVVTTDLTGAAGYNTAATAAGGDYTTTAGATGFGGTSSASPLTAAIGALMLNVNPSLTNLQIRQALRDTADKIGGVTYTSGFNPYYGYGRVDAHAALTRIAPDLVGQDLVLTNHLPASAAGTVPIGYHVVNQGQGASVTSGIDFFLSEDATITDADQRRTSIGLPALAAGGSIWSSTSMSLPAYDPFRTDNQYYIGMHVDWNRDAIETNETNNVNRGDAIDRAPLSAEKHLPSPLDGATVVADPLPNSSTRSGTIGDEWIGPADMDVYRFTGFINRKVFLDLDTPVPTDTLDTYIRVYDASFTLLASNDDAAAPGETDTGYDSYLVFTPPADGSYYVVVGDYQNRTANPRTLAGRVTTGGTGAFNLTLAFLDVIPPYVADAWLQYEDAPNYLAFQFSEDVGASLGANDLVLTNMTSAIVVPWNLTAVAWDPYFAIARWTFPGYANGQLPDGNYIARLRATSILDPYANPLDGNHDGVGGDDFYFQFYVLGGDANRDRAVNFDDLVVLAQNYNTTGGNSWSTGDFNGDTDVDFDDLVVLAQHYNTTLPPLDGAAPARATAGERAWPFATAPVTPKDLLDEVDDLRGTDVLV